MISKKFTLALVTGATSGIGAELCRLLAGKGIPLLMTGRNEAQLKLLSEELRLLTSVDSISADLSLDEDRKNLMNMIQEKMPDLVINNAGFGIYGLAMNDDTKNQTRMIDVNARALLEITLEAVKAMITSEKKGVVLNVSSVADKVIMPGMAVYAATKAFVTQVSRSLDEESGPYGVRVLVSCPGVVVTDFRRRASGKAEALQDRNGMDAAYAAEQIWKQILREKQIHYFDFKAHLTAFLARFILPQKLISKFLRRKIESFRNT